MRTFGTGEKVILAVEDDDSAYRLMEIAFEEVGGDFQLYRAVDGEQALSFIQRSKDYANVPAADLILLNLNLPKLSGLEVLRAIHEDPRVKKVPAVVFSSSQLDQDKARCMALGARAFVTKPIDLNDFIQAVSYACSFA